MTFIIFVIAAFFILGYIVGVFRFALWLGIDEVGGAFGFFLYVFFVAVGLIGPFMLLHDFGVLT